MTHTNQSIASCVRAYRSKACHWLGVIKAASLDAASRTRLANAAEGSAHKSSHAVARAFLASGPAPVEVAATDYDAMTVDELYTLGKSLGLAVTTKLRKAELIAVLEAAA